MAAPRPICIAAWPEPSPHPNPPPLAGEGVLADAASKTLPRKRGREARRGSGGRVGAAAGEGVCYSAAFGVAAARAGIALDDALLGYLQAFAANLMSACLRLGLIGQTDGQRILAALEPVIVRATETAIARDPAGFGAATFAGELPSLDQE